MSLAAGPSHEGLEGHPPALARTSVSSEVGVGRVWKNRASGLPPPRVWLYVDDQLQQMKPHRGSPPEPQPQPEGSPSLLLGGLPGPDTLHFSGCISNVFVRR